VRCEFPQQPQAIIKKIKAALIIIKNKKKKAARSSLRGKYGFMIDICMTKQDFDPVLGEE
jgi:hypothetical protein